MDTDIRERLEEEMCNCKSIRPYKNRVRKHNEILPNEIVENILSFIPCECKRCVKTREILDKKKKWRWCWKGFKSLDRILHWTKQISNH